MALGSLIAQRSPYVNLPASIPKKQDKFVGIQGLAGRFNIGSNKALTSFETLIPPFILFLAQDLFTKFMKMVMELT